MLRRKVGEALCRKGCDDSFIRWSMLRRNPSGMLRRKLPWTLLFSAFHVQIPLAPQVVFRCIVIFRGVTIIADLMKKYPSIPKRLNKDYHSIKDDIPLVSVYITGNVLFRGMLIPDAFLTNEIRATNDFKEYETVFVEQKRKQVSEETSSPRKSLKVTIKQKQVVEGEKDAESYASKFAASMLDDSGNRIEPESHKENPEVLDDDDVNDAEQKDKKKGDFGINEMGRTEKMQTPIPTTPISLRINLSLDKTTVHELTDIVSPSTTTTSKDPQKEIHISNKYNHLPGALGRMCRRQ
ncbi:hypothetical protein Tco_0977128 [Tanacetum coccineum]|uniref:Uncharacterized protein n=1 Tax=Tanacetum coccineum TaxID=301880 RepID=A0ABQ5EJ86_9ASTR